VFLCLVVTALSGCASPFQKFYNGSLDAKTLSAYDKSYVVKGGVIPIYSTNDPTADVRTLGIKGFVVLGSSSFYATENKVNEDDARKFGEKIGAHIILVQSKYKDTVSGVTPLILPNTTTSYSTGNASAYGYGNHVTAQGSSVTSTYGTQTTYIPYSSNRSDYLVVYLCKFSPRLGIVPMELADDERKSINTNSAVKVDYAIEGTTAFLADVFPGDILLRINDQPVAGIDSFISLIDKYQGSDAKFHFVRDGKEIDKVIHIKQ